MDLKRLSDPVLRRHLELDSPSKAELRIQTFLYESVYTELQAICAPLSPKDKVWICDKASRALMQVLPKVRESCSLYSTRLLVNSAFVGLMQSCKKTASLLCSLLVNIK